MHIREFMPNCKFMPIRIKCAAKTAEGNERSLVKMKRKYVALNIL